MDRGLRQLRQLPHTKIDYTRTMHSTVLTHDTAMKIYNKLEKTKISETVNINQSLTMQPRVHN